MSVRDQIEAGLADGGAALVSAPRDRLMAWARSQSIEARVWSSACCVAEGHERAEPQPAFDRCTVLIVAGPVSLKQAPLIRSAWEAMPEPKWTMAVGACACSGGGYEEYATPGGLDAVVPVDVFVPGCPPSARSLDEGLEALAARIRVERRGRATDGWKEGPRAHSGDGGED